MPLVKNHWTNHWPWVVWVKEADIVGVARPASGVITGGERSKLGIKNVSLFLVERFRLLIDMKDILLFYELFFFLFFF